MSLFTVSARAALLAAGIGIAAAGAMSPAVAKDDKGKTITMPAAALQDPSAKLCMPRNVIDDSKHSTLPKTVCQTRDEWAAQGVTIVAKK